MIDGPKPTLLIYGNCQAFALTSFFRASPIISCAYNVRYFASFDDHSPGSRSIAPQELASTVLFFEQADPNIFPFLHLLPSDCVTLTFPAIDLNLLWPLSVTNTYSVPTLKYPWGRFPYGDRVIVDCVERGLSLEETLAYYRASSWEHLPDLDRFRMMEIARLRSRDASLDITMSDFVFDRLSHENVFWCLNHPTMVPMRELARRLLTAGVQRIAQLQEIAIDAIIDTFPLEGPLAFLRVPIHPAIVERYDMEWYHADEGPNYGFRQESPLTYEQYFRELTSEIIEVFVSRSPATNSS
jgi:hypothetical protein